VTTKAASEELTGSVIADWVEVGVKSGKLI